MVARRAGRPARDPDRVDGEEAVRAPDPRADRGRCWRARGDARGSSRSPTAAPWTTPSRRGWRRPCGGPRRSRRWTSSRTGSAEQGRRFIIRILPGAEAGGKLLQFARTVELKHGVDRLGDRVGAQRPVQRHPGRRPPADHRAADAGAPRRGAARPARPRGEPGARTRTARVDAAPAHLRREVVRRGRRRPPARGRGLRHLRDDPGRVHRRGGRAPALRDAAASTPSSSRTSSHGQATAAAPFAALRARATCPGCCRTSPSSTPTA